MSLKTVTMRRVECDAAACKEATEVTAADSVEARFEAASLGWKYAAVRSGGKGPARRFDYCPIHAGEVSRHV